LPAFVGVPLNPELPKQHKEKFMAYSLRLRVHESLASLCVFGTALVAVLSLVAFPAATASAQEAAAEDKAVEEIVVTGSRIRRSEFTSVSPIQVIDMEQSTLAGLIDISDIIQGSTVAASSTQINNMLSGFVVNGGPGVNTVDLRGLGAGKTLTLLNGRRLAPAGTRGTVSSVDLNTLPASIIQRVEILKDGASAIYGSDAVAGVVNIITRNDIDGFVGHAQTSIPNDSGGEITSADVAWGFNTDNANIIIGVEWFERKGLTIGDRDWSKCRTEYYFDPDTGEDISTIDPTTGQPKCWNSPANDYVVVQSGQFGGRWIRDGSVDCVGAPAPCAPGWRVGSLAERKFDNERQQNAHMISPAERINFFSFGDIDLSSTFGGAAVSGYYEYMYNSRKSEQHGGPRQFAVRVAQQSILAQNFSPFYDPAAPFSELPLLLPYDQVGDQEVNWTRALAGLTGEISSTSWAWDVHYAYGRSHASYSSPQMLIDRVVNSLDIIPDPNNPGSFDCRINLDDTAAGNSAPTCVPFNPWNQIGQINNFDQDVLGYITSTETGQTTYEQNVIDGYLTGNLFEMPAGSVGAVFGFQYRKEEINDVPSSGSIASNLWGFTSSGITAGNDTVKEVYTEIEVPLLREVTAFQDLTLALSGRWTDYDTFGDDTVYKVGLNWQIIDQFRLRSSFGTSFRAPALYENFLGGQTAFSSAADPCADYGLEDPAQAIYQNCDGEIGDLNYAGFTSTPQVITFGNAGRLTAETSEALTVGAVFDFDSIGLSFAVDYFDYDIEDEIERFGARSILSQCYNLPTDQFRDPGTICDFISTRDPADNNIDEINNSYFNINRVLVEGYDVTVRYALTLSSVDFVADFRGTKLETWERELFGGVVDDLNGTIGLPDWNAQFDLRANWNNWTFYYGMDWIGAQEDYTFNDIDPATSDWILSTDDVFYHAISARFTSDNWSAQLGVSNLTDETPPLVSDVLQTPAENGAAFHTGYDYRGRSVFLNLAVEF
jgi:iron complex outermembrane receptor protein